jgi:hypothetical protein
MSGAALSAPSQMTADASIVPGLATLYLQWQELEQQAIRMTNMWELVMQAGGFAPAASLAYGNAYSAQIAADQAQAAWLAAYQAANPAPPHGPVPPQP